MASTIKSILAHEIEPGEQVTIEGWVRSRRTSKGGISFIHVDDGSCFDNLQAVVNEDLGNYDEVVEIQTGCSVRITGELVKSEGRGQDREIHATEVEVVGWVEDPATYPVAKKRHTFEFLRGVAHLRPRTNTFGAMARVRHATAQAVHRYFDRNGFLWINTPIVTASDCEGAGELFRVSKLDQLRQQDYSEDFFGQETFLTVSGQLNVEAFCCSLSKVYTFGPTFRAENSNTSRHLAEFWMIEPEIAFADLGDLVDLSEDFVKAVLRDVLDQREDDLAFFNQFVDKTLLERLQAVIDKPFERIDYGKAIEILKKSGQKFEFPVDWGLDLQSEHERYLTEHHVKGPAVIVNYPKEIKAFYMRHNDDDKTVAAMDVLVPGVGEIIGGSQREERLDVLDEKLNEKGIADELWWYRDLRRYGTVPHAGFGLGYERLVLYMTGMENIRDASPFPRTPGNATF
ncbi:MAG: asparagine--tRNA ligase [Gammaproteobacteria bacterium]|nr:asparagine--tRNA ligase [Gammaproteobacteria bacterium]NND61529.1 asparagine--tRNA ligase [Gammaproteobacteria bacterium]